MARRFMRLGLLVAALAAVVTGFPGQAQSAEVTGVRAGVNGDATRFVLDLTGEVSFEVFTLADPDRVVIDFSEVSWSLPADSHRLETGMITGFRYGHFDAGHSRIVLDTTQAAGVKAAFLLEPSANFGYRFVLDLEPRGATFDEVVAAVEPETSFVASAWDGPPLPAIKPHPDRWVIVIDAGHGGVDPGAIGISGTREKDITLTAARDLKALLEATGRYHVVLTRDDDIFLRLGDRVTAARSAGADLFISIHADSIADASVHGAGVYTLSETASDKEADQLAQQENKADLIAGVDFINVSYDAVTTNILIDLAQRETKNASSSFATLLTSELNQAVDLRGNAHRFAGFRVLKAPDVPSVLLEMGYLSNATEERNMLDAAFRQRFMSAVVEAVDAFFSTRDL
jgi:N-acetylmuramoyl-L-alanine amidase